jgi:hypothetical protein
MERIVLEIDNALARAWKNSSPALRSSYENKITALLRELQEEEFGNLLDRTGEIAAGKGLSEQEVQDLLADDYKNALGGKYEWWKDDDLIEDLDRRSSDLKNGKDKGLSLEESKEQLMARLRKNG